MTTRNRVAHHIGQLFGHPQENRANGNRGSRSDGVRACSSMQFSLSASNAGCLTENVSEHCGINTHNPCSLSCKQKATGSR